MRKSNAAIILAIATISASALAPAPIAAQDIAFSGYAKTVHAIGIPKEHSLIESRTIVRGEIDVQSDESRLHVAANAEYDGAVHSRTGFSLGEAWYDFGLGPLNLTLGRQIIAWGKADGIPIADIVCPRDMTAFSAVEYADTRIPVDAVRVDLAIGEWSVEATWIPVFTPAKLPITEDNPLSSIARPAAVTASGTELPVTWFVADTPKNVADGEYAACIAWAGAAFDASAYAFSGWDDIPRTKKTLVIDTETKLPWGVSVSADWYRISMFGADISVPVGPIVFRAEGAYIHDRYFPCVGLADPMQNDQVLAMAGFDWTPDAWIITAQYIEDIVPERDRAMERDQRNPGTTVSVSRKFFRDTLEITSSGYLGLSKYDAYASISASYAFDDHLAIGAGADLFSGGPENDGGYESYEDLSSIYLKGTYQF